MGDGDLSEIGIVSQLIIVVLAVGLTAATATAAMIYMGPAVTDNRARLEAASIVAQMQQIAAAWMMYRRIHGDDPAGSTSAHILDAGHDLVTTKFMTEPPVALRGTEGRARFVVNPDPVAPDITVSIGTGLGAELVGDICAEVNRIASITTPVTTAPAAADASAARGETTISHLGCLLQHDGAAAVVLYRL